MTRPDDKATERKELMAATVQTPHASHVSELNVYRKLKQAIICFQGQTVQQSIKCFLKVSMLVAENCRV